LLLVFSRYIEVDKNQWDLVIIGDGLLEGKLKSLTQTLRIESRVHFIGHLPAHKLAPYYGLASAFILPSSHFEQWGLVVNEAMAAGLPVLVSDVCGCVPDLVINGNTGYSFDPNDTNGFLERLVKMSSDYEKCIQMGKSAQKHIQNYSLARFADNFIIISRIAMKNSGIRKGFPFL
jgi:1,2-diacylglycerol 3-alpha-glucosyltransferase